MGLVSLLFAGCFSPRYEDGGFTCGTDSGCPSGQACYVGRCWFQRAPLDSGVADELAEAGSPEGGRDAIPEVLFVSPPRQLEQTCSPSNRGTPNRTDDCAAGLVCVDGNGPSLCLRNCDDPTVCDQGPCEQRQVEIDGPLVNVCGLGSQTCDPVHQNQPPACPAGRICYVAAGTTICEFQSGDKRSTACSYARECLPGFTCPADGLGSGYCRRICNDVVPCDQGTCQPIAGSAFGYCY